MSSHGRREKLNTVHNLVVLMLHDPNQTRKDLMDKMTGKNLEDTNRPEELTGISRQSVYKALDFLKSSGIVIEKSNETVFRINKRTIKSVIMSIDMDKVRELYAKLWIEIFTTSHLFKSLPEEAKKIIIKSLEERSHMMNMLDVKEEGNLLKLYAGNRENNVYSNVLDYLMVQNIENVMEYLELYSELKN